MGRPGVSGEVIEGNAGNRRTGHGVDSWGTSGQGGRSGGQTHGALPSLNWDLFQLPGLFDAASPSTVLNLAHVPTPWVGPSHDHQLGQTPQAQPAAGSGVNTGRRSQAPLCSKTFIAIKKTGCLQRDGLFPANCRWLTLEVHRKPCFSQEACYPHFIGKHTITSGGRCVGKNTLFFLPLCLLEIFQFKSPGQR